MLKKLKIFILLSLSIVASTGLALGAYSEAGYGSGPAQPPSLDALKSQIPAPVSDFINSAQKVGSDFTYKASWISTLNVLNPRTAFNKIDQWFYDTTGTKLVDVLKPVGNLLVWLFSTLANLIRWGLSLI